MKQAHGPSGAPAATRGIDRSTAGKEAVEQEPSAGTLVVSACLLGRACRYDGGSRPSRAVAEQVAAWPGRVAPVCPEELGGLGTPREPAELRGGDGEQVLAAGARVCRTKDDADVTRSFVEGALAAARVCEGPSTAILKARSPSCGVGETRIDGALLPGDGVFAALLRRRGVSLLNDEDLA